MDGVDGGAQATGCLLVLLDLGVEAEDFLTHVLVLTDEREIPDDDETEAGQEQKENDCASQFVPDAEIDFHLDELSRRWLRRKEDKFDSAPPAARQFPVGSEGDAGTVPVRAGSAAVTSGLISRRLS